MSEVILAVTYLHMLGLAYNDLTPLNIIINKYNTPVLVNFSSCQLFSCKLITARTLGWIKQDFANSRQDHDAYTVGKLQAWLKA